MVNTDLSENGWYALFMVVFLVWPAQGFLNCLVYYNRGWCGRDTMDSPNRRNPLTSILGRPSTQHRSPVAFAVGSLSSRQFSGTHNNEVDEEAARSNEMVPTKSCGSTSV